MFASCFSNVFIMDHVSFFYNKVWKILNWGILIIKSFILSKTLWFLVSHFNWFIESFSFFKAGNRAFQSLENQTKVHYSSDHKLLTQFSGDFHLSSSIVVQTHFHDTSICQPLFDRVTLMSLTYKVKELANNANSDRVFITQH